MTAARGTDLLLVGVLAVAAALRLADIGAAPLWFDEAYSVWFSDQSWRYLWREAPTHELHPPFYYSVLKLWRALAGDSEAALRLPSAFASLATVAAIYVAGRAAGGPTDGRMLGLTAAALAAGWRLQIELAQDARMYAFAVLGVAMLLAGGMRLIARTPDDAAAAPVDPPAWAFVLVATGMALTAWSHNLGVIPVGLGGIWLALWWAVGRGAERRLFWRLAATAVAALALYAPNLQTLLMQTRTISSGFWIPLPADIAELAMITARAYAQSTTELLGFRPTIALAAVWTALGVLGFWRLGGMDWFWRAGFLAVLAGGVWMTLTAMSYLGTSVLLPRLLAFGMPALMVVLAAAPWSLPRAARMPAAVALALLCLAFARTPTGAFAVQRPYPDIVARLAAAPATPVVLAPAGLSVPLDHYAAQAGVTLTAHGLDVRDPTRRADSIIAALRGHDHALLVHRARHLIDPDNTLTIALRDDGWCESVEISGDTDVQISRLDRCVP